jgi:hypothetical protein
MQESKFLQELTIGEGYGVPFVLAQSGGMDDQHLPDSRLLSAQQAPYTDVYCRTANEMF